MPINLSRYYNVQLYQIICNLLHLISNFWPSLNEKIVLLLTTRFLGKNLTENDRNVYISNYVHSKVHKNVVVATTINAMSVSVDKHADIIIIQRPKQQKNVKNRKKFMNEHIRKSHR